MRASPALCNVSFEENYPAMLKHASHVQVHKGKLRTVAYADMPVDIRIAARRQRKNFNSWRLGLGPEALYTPQTCSTGPHNAPTGAPHRWPAGFASVMLAVHL